MPTSRPIEIKFQNELIRMENVLIAGQEADGENSTSMYIGHLDLDELHNALFYIHSGVIKILVSELGIPLDNCDDFLLSAMTEALTREWNVQNGHAPDVAVSKVIKYRKD
jgi:hypothetical protein